MITRSTPAVQMNKQASEPQSWQKQLAGCITQPEELLDILGLDTSLLPSAVRASKAFSLRVPHSYVARMEHGNPDDPLLRQVLPMSQELEEFSGFTMDPLGEKDKTPTEGVIHKYHGRVLLITSGACAINCRFCFRRHFPYNENQLTGQHLENALSYIRSEPSIREVILSGGDPLAASDRRLEALCHAVSHIPHVKVLRIHSRLPVVLPDRVNQFMQHWLQSTRLKTVVVLHANHANEIDQTVRRAITALQSSGVTVLNQTVLLKNINDDVDSLIKLSEALFDAGVLPYYLHLLDKVQGAAHFDVTMETAQSLVKGMIERCPGYLVPKLVQEVAGKPSKSPIPVA